MKFGIFGTALLYPKNSEYTISGHAQVPLKTASLLAKDGHDVDIITTSSDQTYGLPTFVPDDVGLRKVVNVFDSPRGGKSVKRKYLRLIKQLHSILNEDTYDKFHFFGMDRVGILHKILRLLGTQTKTYHTYVAYKRKYPKIDCIFSYLVDFEHMFFTTSYCKDLYPIDNTDAKTSITRPGLIREFSEENSSDIPFDDYILFWRNASFANGADICEEAFKQLSKKYQNMDFVFAVRHQDHYESAIEDICNRVKNMHLLRFPYPNGITIEKLLTEAKIITLPFRDIGNPQWAVLESLASGRPLITTRGEFLSDLISHRQNGILISEDPNSLETEIENLIKDSNLADRIGASGKDTIKSNWSWNKYMKDLIEGYNL